MPSLVCLRFNFHVVNQHSLECLSCKHKNTVFEYEFLITAITKAKARLHVNRFDGCFHEKLSGCSAHLQTDRLKQMQDCSWDPLNWSIQSNHRPFIKFRIPTASAVWPEQNHSLVKQATCLSTVITKFINSFGSRIKPDEPYIVMAKNIGTYW